MVGKDVGLHAGDRAKEGLNDLGDKAKDAANRMGDALNVLGDKHRDGANRMGDALNVLGDKHRDGAVELRRGVEKAGTDARQAIEGAGRDVGQALVGAADKVGDALVVAAQTGGGRFQDGIEYLGDAAIVAVGVGAEGLQNSADIAGAHVRHGLKFVSTGLTHVAISTFFANILGHILQHFHHTEKMRVRILELTLEYGKNLIPSMAAGLTAKTVALRPYPPSSSDTTTGVFLLIATPNTPSSSTPNLPSVCCHTLVGTIREAGIANIFPGNPSMATCLDLSRQFEYNLLMIEKSPLDQRAQADLGELAFPNSRFKIVVGASIDIFIHGRSSFVDKAGIRRLLIDHKEDFFIKERGSTVKWIWRKEDLLRTLPTRERPNRPSRKWMRGVNAVGRTFGLVKGLVTGSTKKAQLETYRTNFNAMVDFIRQETEVEVSEVARELDENGILERSFESVL